MEHLIPVKKQGARGIFQIFSRTTRVSATNEKTIMSTKPTPDIAESSTRGDPDLGRGYPNPQYAGGARWNPNCSAEARN